MKKIEKNKVLGVSLILIAIIILVLFFLFSNRSENDNGKKEEKLPEVERDYLIADVNSNANDEKDIDNEVAKKIMQLEVLVADAVKEDVFNGNIEPLREQLEDYLVRNDFYMEVTRAVCSQVVTRDFLTNTYYLEFDLNNKQHTTITAEYDPEREFFIFNFY